MSEWALRGGNTSESDEREEIRRRTAEELADVYVDWCGPYKMLASEYGVQGVPTVVPFADGRLAERLVGVRDEDALKRLVEHG